jgi:hypothetical protein
VTDRALALNVWSGAATVLVVAALTSLVAVLTGPYSSTDSKIFYSLGATLLAGSTFFAALALMERRWVLGYAALLATPFGWLILTYALWQEATSTSNADSEFWTGIIVLVTALLVVTSHLLADSRIARFMATGASALALVAAVVSLAAAWTDEQFWRVGTPITSLWIAATVLYFLVPVVDRAVTRSGLWLGGAVALLGVALAGVVAVVSGEFAPQGYSLFLTLIAAVVTTSPVLAGVVALERGSRFIGWTAVVVGPLAFTLLSEGIWHDTEDRFRYVATGIVLGLALLVAVPARLFAATPVGRGLAGGAGVLAAATAVLSIEGIWRDDRYFLIARATTALWILAVLCCLLVPLVERYLAADQPPREAVA